MALQLSAAVRNAMLDAIETTIGTSAVLKIRTGAAPASVATADSGTVLATLTLPSDWMAAASSGSKAKSGGEERTDCHSRNGGLRIKQVFLICASGAPGQLADADSDWSGSERTDSNAGSTFNQCVSARGPHLSGRPGPRR